MGRSQRACIFFSLSTFLTYLLIGPIILQNGYHHQDKKMGPITSSNSTNKNGTMMESYLVNTKMCQIMETTVWPEFFQKWTPQKTPNCDDQSVLLGSIQNSSSFAFLHPQHQNSSSCFLTEIIWNEQNDGYLYVQPAIPLKKSSESLSNGGTEFFRIDCAENETNFAFTVPINQDGVKKKIFDWDQKPENEKKKFPPNILLLAFDSQSRSHFHRSLSKTIPLLEEMGFTEFRGHHATSLYTTRNIHAFLAGITPSDAQKQTHGFSIRTLDVYPFVWQNFSDAGYITMDADDGEMFRTETDGFKFKPVDYYPHPLLKNMNQYWQNRTGKDWLQKLCASGTESMAQFLLRYTEEFMSKFQNFPFFAFTFLAYPFHDHYDGLPSIDDGFANFLENLKKSPQILNRTLIAIFADHGDRLSFFKNRSFEAFVERSLPPLFLRVPEILEKNYPEIKHKWRQNVESNSHRLTTHFDIHHTLLHILSLNSNNNKTSSSSSEKSEEGPSEFQPSLKDRSSLFVQIGEDRTCEEVHVPDQICVCGVKSQSDKPLDPFVLSKMTSFLIEELNRLVRESREGHLCVQWIGGLTSLYSASVVKETALYDELLVHLRLDPDDAMFQVMVGVEHFEGGQKFKILGDFSRVDSYGTSSHCIETSQGTKILKEICHCVQQPLTES